MRVAAPFEGPTCGLVPLGAPAVLTTRGLHWDVTDWPSAFGGRVSTSNRVERYPEARPRAAAAGGGAAAAADTDVEVEVEASSEVVWTASCRAAEEDGDVEEGDGDGDEEEGAAR